jgi:hypothetical protein
MRLHIQQDPIPHRAHYPWHLKAERPSRAAEVPGDPVRLAARVGPNSERAGLLALKELDQ